MKNNFKICVKNKHIRFLTFLTERYSNSERTLYVNYLLTEGTCQSELHYNTSIYKAVLSNDF